MSARIWLAVGLAGLLLGCSAPPAESPPPRLVRVLTVGAAASGPDGAAGTAYAGEISPRIEHAVAFQIGGRILSRAVEVGAQVQAGDELARLDPADVQANLQAARAQVAAAEAQLALARNEWQRSEALFRQSFISRAALDAQKASLDAAQAQLRQARAQAEVADNQLQYAVLRAPHAGVVAEAQGEAGQVVAAGQVLFRIVPPGEREVLIHIPETRIRAHPPGLPAKVKVWSAERIHDGVVREVSPVADRISRTYAVRVAVAGDDAELPLGATANVWFAQANGGEAIRVPSAAVTRIGEQARVWVVDEAQQVQPRSVELLRLDERGALIRGDLPVGMRVVVAGVHQLVAGEEVRTQDDQSAVVLDIQR